MRTRSVFFFAVLNVTFFTRLVIHFQSPSREERSLLHLSGFVNSALSWALITVTPNIRHPFMWHFYCFAVLLILLTASSLEPKNTSLLLSGSTYCSLQDNTQKYGYLCINTSPPSFNSPPRTRYTFSLLMPTVVSLPSVLISILQQRWVTVYTTASKCLHNSPVSYDQVK